MTKDDINDKNNQEERSHQSDIPEELKEALQEVPEQQREKVLRAFLGISIQRSTSFSGPLPPPSLLREYSEIVENGAERIFRQVANRGRTQHSWPKHWHRAIFYNQRSSPV